MTTWTTIPDSELAVDAPARSINALQLRDNPIAMSEGASGAPRSHIKSMSNGEVVAGSAVAWELDDVGSTTQSAYSATDIHDGVGVSVGVRVFCEGTITAKVSHFTASASHSSFVRVIKNGVLVQEWSTTSTSPVARSVNVSVVFGDIVSFQQRSSSSGQSVSWQDKSLTADSKFWQNSPVGV